MSELKLQVEHLAVNYGNVNALKDISFEVPTGKIITLIGSNGAGKTTTLRAISGIVERQGSIKLSGQEVRKVAPHEMVGLGVIHCPEGRGIFPNLSVMENLQLGVVGRPTVEDRFEENLEKSLKLFPRIRERLKQVAGTLSGGEQQMLAIARALLAEPEVLLLDEPSLGLAPQVVKLIFDTVKKINQEAGVTVLLVEQNAKQALKISHFGYVLEAGKIRLKGPSQELLENDEVRKIYLGDH